MKIGYARVSTKEQSFDLQLDALRKAGCKKIYQETVSGAKAARLQLDLMLDNLRAGDVLVIWKLDRLGRSLQHLVELVHGLMEKGVGLKSLSQLEAIYGRDRANILRGNMETQLYYRPNDSLTARFPENRL